MFLVLYEVKPSTGPRLIRCAESTHPEWKDADEVAKLIALNRKVRAWVYEVTDPPMLEVPTTAEIKQFRRK